MTRTMYDSTTAADIPAGSALVMGYVWEPRLNKGWTDADWARFPGRKLVRLCIFNDRLDANVIDVEPGNNDAHGAVPWIAAKWARGEPPTVYCFSDRGPTGYRISDVRAACDAAGVKRPLIIITDFDNDPSSFDPAGDPEIIGKQYANDDLTGGHYDVSVVADHWPGVDAAGGGAMATSPTYVGQSAGIVNAIVGEVVEVDGIWHYPDHGGNRTIIEKVYAPSAPGFWPYTMHAPADPDADPTRDLDAQPAYWIIAARAK